MRGGHISPCHGRRREQRQAVSQGGEELVARGDAERERDGTLPIDTSSLSIHQLSTKLYEAMPANAR